MKKTILTAGGAFLACVVAAVAGPINSKGIPANVYGIIHVDCDAILKSPLGKESERVTKTTPKLAEILDSIKKIGVTQVNDFTVGMLPPGSKNENDLVVVIRGQFQPALIYAEAEKEKVPIVSSGKHRFIGMDRQKLERGKGCEETGPDSKPEYLYICPIDAKTIIGVSDLKFASLAITAFTDAGKSFVPPASLIAYGKYSGTPWVLVYGKTDPKSVASAPKKGMDAMIPAIPSNSFFALGEADGVLKFRLTTDYATDEEAQQMYGTVQMLLGMAPMLVENKINGPDKLDPAEAKGIEELARVVKAVKHSTKGKRYNLSFDWPLVELIKFIKEAEAERKTEK